VQAMRQVVDHVAPEYQNVAQLDLGVARAANLHFASVANQARFIMARDALVANDLDDGTRAELRGQLQEILAAETDAAVALYQLAKEDSRIGYEASNHYFYVPLDLVEKVVNCAYLRETLGGAAK